MRVMTAHQSTPGPVTRQEHQHRYPADPQECQGAANDQAHKGRDQAPRTSPRTRDPQDPDEKTCSSAQRKQHRRRPVHGNAGYREPD